MLRYKKLNKKGSEKLFSIWWILMIIFVGVIITAGVIIYHGAEINLKKIPIFL